MFPSTTIPKIISIKTSTSRSDWVKTNKKSIDMIGNSCILAVANSDLTLIQFTTGS